MTPGFFDKGEDRAETSGRGAAMLAQVRAYWEGLRTGDSLPTRSQFDPRGIEGALSSTFLLERIAPGLARFRIAGMDLTDLMGMELRGMPLSAVFCPEQRAQLATVLEPVFSKPAILTMALTAEKGFARPALTARLLVLPMRSDAGEERLALGCFALEGGIGRSPRRFGIDSHALLHLPRDKAESPSDWPRKGAFTPMPVRSTATQHEAAFAEAAATYGTKGKTAVPYLRLVKSDN
ncbi:PAS domain-containing protein [Pseudorhodobacter sp. E13]|uniref:PAS domain-containing protein n=1 Tax=Pseudorhodobacter sp. E13 TaxID=2487931 RepID=UPI0018F2D3EB|nr:PAS domain-containing protein [Pseudorhodobacter sp. E13]